MRTRKDAVVLMTALVPTIGHEALIRFASELVGPHGYVDVIVSGRSFEPVPLEHRVNALQAASDHLMNVVVHSHFDDDAPQNPATPEEWDYWKKLVTHNGAVQYDYFVASEPYGKTMADLIEAEFVPFDMDRRMLSVRGTNVRRDLWAFFEDVIPEMRPYLRKTVTIFGQESTGKTTMTDDLGLWFGGITHEFARPYLELKDTPEVTKSRMETIMYGQYALQKTVNQSRHYLTIQDTDLLSTIGYYRIFGVDAPREIEELFQHTKSDLYIVTPDNIPFKPDPLRYGGDVRESNLQFWIDLLEEYGCEYRVLTYSQRRSRREEAVEIVKEYLEKWTAPIRDFVRE